MAPTPTPRAAPASPKIAIGIDASTRFQKIDGFGASSLGGFSAFERGRFDHAVPLGVTYKTTPEQRTAILTAAIRELGMTHVRLWLPPEAVEPPLSATDPRAHDWSNYDWRGDSGKPGTEDQLRNRANGLVEWGEFLRTAVPLGLKNWIVTPGWMPGWLQQKFASQSPDRYDQYADWAAAHLSFLKRRFGFEAPFWSLHNEPDHLGWNDPAFWHQLIQTTGVRFRKEGLATKLVAPDFMNAGRAVELMSVVLQSDETRQYLGALAYHHYATSGDGPRPFLEVTASPATADAGPRFEQITSAARAMAALGKKFRLPSWQTETAYYPRSYQGLSEWEIGRGRANEIFYELSSGASAVQGMFLFWPDAFDPRYGINVRSEGHPIVLSTDGKKVKRWMVTKDAGAVFAHYARFVRPGDWRIAAEYEDPMIRTTAFLSESSRRCVVVAINNSDRPKSLSLQIDGLPWKSVSCGALITTERKTLEPHPVTLANGAENSCAVILPGFSVCTLVWSETEAGTLALPPEILKR